jgi:mono/diheme cytochrome c family protein
MKSKMKTVLLGIALLIPNISSMCMADDLVDDPVFKSKCAMCHGSAAEGKEQRHTPPMKTKASKPVEELTKQIEDGNDKQTPKMPPFKDKLTPEQIKALVDEIKALK